MTSRGTVRRKTGATTTVGGFEVPTWETVHTDLPLRLSGTDSRTIRTPGFDAQAATRVAHLPYGTSDLQDGDLLEVTSGENEGLVLRLLEADWADQQTARRVFATVTQRPAEWA
jgi:hypothetical protein